jgi:uncharacterized membrane protein YtjA (UPF0391 family)
MLKLAFVFLAMSLIAGVLGFTGLAGAALGLAKILFFLFLVLSAALLLLGMSIFRPSGR